MLSLKFLCEQQKIYRLEALGAREDLSATFFRKISAEFILLAENKHRRSETGAAVDGARLFSRSFYAASGSGK
jgi:hypothetical protein